MSEDRTLADHIKGTFAVRAARLAAKGPGDDGDKTYSREQYNALYGLLWEVCQLFCLKAVTDPDNDSALDYDEVLGLKRDLEGKPIKLRGPEAVEAQKRKIRWLLNKYTLAYGPMSARERAFLTADVTSRERVAAVARSWDNRTGNAEFRGDPTRAVAYSVDDPDEDVGTKLRT